MALVTTRVQPVNVVIQGKSVIANAAVLLLLAAYLAAVVWNGNVGAFATQAWADFSGRKSNQPAFWQWALAFIILYALGENDATSHLFGPLLAIMVVAMLIQLAIKQPQIFNTLDNNIRFILGAGTVHRT